MTWALGHDGHELVDANERNWHCRTCGALVSKQPERDQLTVEAQADLHDDAVGVDLVIRKSWGSGGA